MLRILKLALKSRGLRSSLVFAIGLFAQGACAQITGNPNVIDPKALPITEDLQRQLCGKKWYYFGIVETRRGERHERPQQFLVKSTVFGCRGEFKDSSGEFKDSSFYYKEGKWKTISTQVLQVSYEKTPPTQDRETLINGFYSIYALSDSVLVLGRVLTSSGDWTKEYKFTSTPRVPRKTTWTIVYQQPSFLNPSDSIKPGKMVKYFKNGQISSIRYYGVKKRRVPAEEIFLNNGKLPRDPFHDSTQLTTVPTGEWTAYFPNGKIQSKSYYDSTGRSIGKWLTFSSDGRLVETQTFKHGRAEFNDQYVYEKDQAWPTVRRTGFRKGIMYILGNKDSAQFNQVEFYENGRSGSYVERKIPIRNLSARKLAISTADNPLLDVHATSVVINEGDSSELIVKFRIPTGAVDTDIQLRSAEWTYQFKFHTFGYHLTNSDFDSHDKKQLPPTFVYHRVSDDYELRIQNLKSPKDKYVPVSKQMNEFDLKKGQYQFTLIGPSGRKSIEVEVK